MVKAQKRLQAVLFDIQQEKESLRAELERILSHQGSILQNSISANFRINKNSIYKFIRVL
jgi:hypothetical protein